MDLDLNLICLSSGYYSLYVQNLKEMTCQAVSTLTLSLYVLSASPKRPTASLVHAFELWSWYVTMNGCYVMTGVLGALHRSLLRWWSTLSRVNHSSLEEYMSWRWLRCVALVATYAAFTVIDRKVMSSIPQGIILRSTNLLDQNNRETSPDLSQEESCEENLQIICVIM